MLLVKTPFVMRLVFLHYKPFEYIAWRTLIRRNYTTDSNFFLVPFSFDFSYFSLYFTLLVFFCGKRGGIIKFSFDFPFSFQFLSFPTSPPLWNLNFSSWSKRIRTFNPKLMPQFTKWWYLFLDLVDPFLVSGLGLSTNLLMVSTKP